MPFPKQQEELKSKKDEEAKTSYIESLSGGIELEMIAIPSGSFLMGSTDKNNAQPQHLVTIAAFHIGKCPITQEQYKAVMGNNPSYFSKGGKYPVEQVSWNDAQEFCMKLSQMTGKTYRLPSEAQWEYAARAGTQTLYYHGDNENQLGDYAWYSNNSSSQTHPVGQKKPNQWELYDMLGTVWEWCEDDWHGNYQGAPVDGSAWIDNGNRSQSKLTIRGGSWFNYSLICCCAYRYNNDHARRYLNDGFRVVLAP